MIFALQIYSGFIFWLKSFLLHWQEMKLFRNAAHQLNITQPRRGRKATSYPSEGRWPAYFIPPSTQLHLHRYEITRKNMKEEEKGKCTNKVPFLLLTSHCTWHLPNRKAQSYHHFTGWCWDLQLVPDYLTQVNRTHEDREMQLSPTITHCGRCCQLV